MVSVKAVNCRGEGKPSNREYYTFKPAPCKCNVVDVYITFLYHIIIVAMSTTVAPKTSYLTTVTATQLPAGMLAVK